MALVERVDATKHLPSPTYRAATVFSTIPLVSVPYWRRLFCPLFICIFIFIFISFQFHIRGACADNNPFGQKDTCPVIPHIRRSFGPPA